MMGKRDVKFINGDEWDCLTRWRKYIHLKPGDTKRIKRNFNKRNRKFVKDSIKSNRFDLINI